MSSGPTPTITIREAHPPDREAIAALLAELGYPATGAAAGDRLATLQQDPHSSALVAVRNGTVVGLATLHVFPVIHASLPVALLTALVVSEVARGEGAGRLLVDAAVEAARQHGCGRMIVTTAEHRAGAHAFYSRIGWEYTGRRFSTALTRP